MFEKNKKDCFGCSDNTSFNCRNNVVTDCSGNASVDYGKNINIGHKERSGLLSRNNPLQIIINILSSAIIRHDTKQKSDKERKINKNCVERTGLFCSPDHNGTVFINDDGKKYDE
jgi:hypothetical protein